MSQVLNVDIIDIINAKMDKTEKKYPVDKAKGVSTKYNKLQRYIMNKVLKAILYIIVLPIYFIVALMSALIKGITK